MTDTAPRCPRCHGRMEFQRVDPGIKGFENHVYECGRCYTMKTESVSLGQSDSISAKWADSPLRGPQ
jgi:hypothetical protein